MFLFLKQMSGNQFICIICYCFLSAVWLLLYNAFYKHKTNMWYYSCVLFRITIQILAALQTQYWYTYFQYALNCHPCKSYSYWLHGHIDVYVCSNIMFCTISSISLLGYQILLRATRFAQGGSPNGYQVLTLLITAGMDRLVSV